MKDELKRAGAREKGRRAGEALGRLLVLALRLRLFSFVRALA